VSWFLTLDLVVPLEQVPQRDGLRFSEEHLCRFLKQDVLWLAACVRTPEPFLRWSGMIALALLPLDLAGRAVVMRGTESTVLDHRGYAGVAPCAD
jgi:hypothetical protein